MAQTKVKKQPAECMDCVALPIGERPATPRPIDPRSGPRSPRCWTHIEAQLKARRRAARDRHQSKTYGLSPEDVRELDEAQGFRCPCGNRIKHTDHDHRRARELCEHDPEHGCKRCVRGRMCHTCNSDILGRGYTIRRLEAIVSYLKYPPARDLWGE